MRTTDGRSILTAVKDSRKVELEKSSEFVIDGKTSKYIDNDDKVIDVTFGLIYVELKTKTGHVLSVPNYGDEAHLASMIEHAAELLLFEYDLEM